MSASRSVIPKLCVLVTAAVGLGAAVSAGHASAGSALVTIGSATANVGAEVSVDLQALGIPEPGLGAWTVDITYDPAVVSRVRCSAPIGVCSTAYRADAMRVTGASATGLVGDTTLATLTYWCEAAGVSPLELEVSPFGDLTPAVPQDIEYAVVHGSITCVEPSEPTATEEQSPTETVAPSLPPTGAGGGSGGAPGPLIVTLAGAGAAALAFVSALRLRARRP